MSVEYTLITGEAATYEVRTEKVEVVPGVEGLHMTVNRVDWKDGIPWDDLQAIKDEVAGREARAIEVYPTAQDLVYSENLRHLWVVPESFPLPNLNARVK